MKRPPTPTPPSQQAPPLQPPAEVATRIKVAARIRPLTPREAHSALAVTVPPAHKSSQEWPTDLLVSNALGTRPSRYAFDAILTESASQAHVFDFMAAPLILGVCQGVNAALFAYGQTGTGKTHTMLGVDIWQLASSKKKDDELSKTQRAALQTSDHRGVIPRSMQLLFSTLSDRPHKISVSYFEIYNEKILDLLAPNQAEGKDGPGLEIREDKQRGVHAVGAVCHRVRTVDEVLDALWRGARNRAVSATDMNEHSSRSHTIFQVLVETKSRTGVTSARLNLVDLAGSEKWRPHQLSEFSEQRILEMTSINKSLSNLGNCVRGLMQSGRNHIPYRDSKLTRLLQDSLGGNAQTGFVVTVSPSELALEETMSTLQFADRAKRVSVRATVNEELDDETKMARMEQEIRRLKDALGAAEAAAAAAALQRPPEEENSFSRANKAGGGGAAADFEPKTLLARMEGLRPTARDEALVGRYHDLAGRGALDALGPLERLGLMEWAVAMQAVGLKALQEASERETARVAAQLDDRARALRAKEDELAACRDEVRRLQQAGSTEAARMADALQRKESELGELRTEARLRQQEVEGLKSELRASVAEQRNLKERLNKLTGGGYPGTPHGATRAAMGAPSPQPQHTDGGGSNNNKPQVFSSRHLLGGKTPQHAVASPGVFNSSRHKPGSEDAPPPPPAAPPASPALLWHAFVDATSGKK